MKKIFEYIGLLSVLSFSFFLTDKTINVTRKMDTVMLKIDENKGFYCKAKEEAKIVEDTIVPGINGYIVNVNESYKNMKSIGVYNPSLYIYDTVKVNNCLKNNLDKYIIGGNKNKQMVSIFVFINDVNIDEYLNKIGDRKINFIVNYNYLIENEDQVKNLINQGHNILLNETNDKNIKNAGNILSDYTKNFYCYNENMDEIFLNNCSINKFYSISSNDNEIISNNYLSNVKKILSGGSFIVLDGNSILEIPNIINYIESKGFKIENLDNHLNENV